MDADERGALRRLLKQIYDDMGEAAQAAIRAFAPGGRVPARNGGTGTTQGAEPPLGNPASDGDVLSSTTAGVRSWVPLETFDPTKLSLLTNGDTSDPQLVFAAADVIVVYG